MAFVVRYQCPTCNSMVQLEDKDGKLVAVKAIFCPKFGCEGKAQMVFELK